MPPDSVPSWPKKIYMRFGQMWRAAQGMPVSIDEAKHTIDPSVFQSVVPVFVSRLASLVQAPTRALWPPVACDCCSQSPPSIASVPHRTLRKRLSQNAFGCPEFFVPPASGLGIDPSDDLGSHLYPFGFDALEQHLLRLEFLLVNAQAFNGFVLNID